MGAFFSFVFFSLVFFTGCTQSEYKRGGETPIAIPIQLPWDCQEELVRAFQDSFQVEIKGAYAVRYQTEKGDNYRVLYLLDYALNQFSKKTSIPQETKPKPQHPLERLVKMPKKRGKKAH